MALKTEERNRRNSITSEALILASKKRSWSFTISIFVPKIKVKIPKVITSAMQKKTKRAIPDADNSNTKRKRPWALGRKLIPMVSTKVSDVFGCQRTESIVSDLNGENAAESLSDLDGVILCKAYEDAEDKYESNVSLGEMLAMEVKKGAQKKLAGAKKRHSSFSSSFNKKAGLACIRSKVKKATAAVGSSSPDGVPTTVTRRQNSFPANLVGAPSRMLRRRTCSNVIKKDISQDEQGDYELRKDSSEVELCKKRILMGMKCKPLSQSGRLNYDKKGILLPDVHF